MSPAFSRPDLDSRVTESLNVLRTYVESTTQDLPFRARLMDALVEGLSRTSLGGKHLRSRLVHIAAGDVEAERLHAANVFGACVDLMHGAFLIHDDVIDQDDMRRGQPTVHRHVADSVGDDHVGASIAILAGDLGINGVTQLLLRSGLDNDLILAALNHLSDSTRITVFGEAFDVEHTVTTHPSLDHVRMSNSLKTAHYTFTTPLSLGALAAGYGTEGIAELGAELGAAFQLANDVNDSDADLTGGRVTVRTMQDTADVLAEGYRHVSRAEELISSTLAPQDVQAELHRVSTWIKESLDAHR